MVCAKSCRRVSLSEGTPASRARAMLIEGRSSGRPSRLLRRVSVTNSSISLPVWSEEPSSTEPAPAPACTPDAPDRRESLKNSGGFRNAVSNGSELSVFVPSGVLVLPSHVVVEHGVPEPVDGVRELRLDRRVDVRRVDVERPDRRLHLACELLEHQVLVLHLGDEAGSLEQPLTVAVAAGAVGLPWTPFAFHPARRSAAPGRVSRLEHVVDVVDQPVVLGVEHLVDRGQRDVLVAATVTAGEVVGRAARRRRCPAAAG